MSRSCSSSSTRHRISPQLNCSLRSAGGTAARSSGTATCGGRCATRWMACQTCGCSTSSRSIVSPSGRCVRRTRRAMRSRDAARTVASVEIWTDPGTALLIPMSREQYDEIGEVAHAEWWDGLCVVTPGALHHQRVQTKLTLLLAPTAPDGDELLLEVGVRTPDSDFIPDISLVSKRASVDETGHWFLDPPLLVVEIL